MSPRPSPLGAPVRVGAGLLEHAPTLLRVGGSGARGALGRMLSCDLRLRSGSLRNTMVLDPRGRVLADALLGLDEEDWLLWVEGLSAEEIGARLRADGAEVVDLAEELTVLGVEGPFAWDVLSRFDDPGVLAMPFLSFYRHPDDLLVLRFSRSGELGYQLLVPRARRAEIVERLHEAGTLAGLAPVEPAVLRACHRESWAFDIETPSLRGLDARELGLAWRVSPRSEAVGVAALHAGPPARRLCPVLSDEPLPIGGTITFDDRPVGVLRWSEPFAHGTGAIGGASIDAELAFAHLGFRLDGAPLRTVTPPFVVTRSMWVRPDTHDVSQRDSLPPCAAAPQPPLMGGRGTGER